MLYHTLFWPEFTHNNQDNHCTGCAHDTPSTLQATCHIWTGGKSVHKPATIKQVYPHFFLWMKPANVTQVVGQLLNLPDVGRSLVNFRMCDRFSSQPANVWQVTGQFSGFTNFIYFFWIKPANITQVVGQFDNLHDTSRSLVTFFLSQILKP
mgnify:CR=1 FL=1